MSCQGSLYYFNELYVKKKKKLGCCVSGKIGW